MNPTLLTLLLTALTAPAGLLGCSDTQVGAASAGAADGASTAPYRSELLTLAFESASAMPMQPHVKSRSRAQAAVVDACLELDQPGLARAWIDRIEDWRRGTACASLAAHLVEKDPEADVAPYLDQARQIAASTGFYITQDWQRQRIQSGIARALFLQGDTAEAAQILQRVEPAESARVEATRSRMLEDDDFEVHMTALEAARPDVGLDQMRTVQQACAGLFDRFYADAQRRERAKRAADGACVQAPLQLRLEWLQDLARIALEHSDAQRALELLAEAEGFLDAAHWGVELRVPLASHLAALRYQAGDEERARRSADAAAAFYDTEHTKIPDFERADALRPLAEAYAAMGDSAAALATYRRVVETGAENPNARPRADDLCATCCSMAKSGVEPDAALWERLRAIRAGLTDPW